MGHLAPCSRQGKQEGEKTAVPNRWEKHLERPSSLDNGTGQTLSSAPANTFLPGSLFCPGLKTEGHPANNTSSRETRKKEKIIFPLIT